MLVAVLLLTVGQLRVLVAEVLDGEGRALFELRVLDALLRCGESHDNCPEENAVLLERRVAFGREIYAPGLLGTPDLP